MNPKSEITQIGFFYDFRPIGQGLFSIGRLTIRNKQDKLEHFTWVHDCGSENLTATVFNNEVATLNGILENNGQLDLLILSHFDNDHISGLVSLLAMSRVRRLVIPYLTPAERLLILLSTPAASENLQRFLAGPLDFISTRRGGQEPEIIFIGRSEGPTNNEFGGEFTIDPPVSPIKGKRFSDEQTAGDPDLTAAAKRRPEVLKVETMPLIVWGLWEFCFYNLPPEEVNRAAKLEELWKLVEPDFNEFHRRFQSGENQSQIISNLRAAYRKVFGTTGKQRNDISLVTYTGPVRRNLSYQGISLAPLSKLYSAGDNTRPKHCAPTGQTLASCDFAWTAGSAWHTGVEKTNPSLLYTGDITLNEKRAEVIKYLLTDQRWQDIEVFQVPHHGAESSWKITAGGTPLFTHRYSVFSSARCHKTYKHPRDSVLDALKNTNRILVNEYIGAVFHGYALWGADPFDL